MYLDKPMRDHILLQAIARVNRPYEDKEGRKKPAGFVLDFIGIFSNLEKALAFDSTDIADIISDIEKLKERFKELMSEGRKKYILPLSNYETQDKKIEWILDKFFDEGNRKEFYEFYKELSDIYNIISPDEFLREYLEDMDTLTRTYRIVQEAYDPSLKINREFTKKVEKLVRDNVNQGVIKDTLDIYEINEDTIKKIDEKNISDQEKVFNLTKSINKLVENESHTSPYLISISERAENIMQNYKERQLSTQQALEEIKKLIEEINTAKKEQAESGMQTEVFSTYWILRQERISNNREIAMEMGEILNKYPHWKVSESYEREVKQKCLNKNISKSN